MTAEGSLWPSLTQALTQARPLRVPWDVLTFVSTQLACKLYQLLVIWHLHVLSQLLLLLSQRLLLESYYIAAGRHL